MFCKYCGGTIDRETMKCTSCGKPVGSLAGGSGFKEMVEKSLSGTKEDSAPVMDRPNPLNDQPVKTGKTGLLGLIFGLLGFLAGLAALGMVFTMKNQMANDNKKMSESLDSLSQTVLGMASQEGEEPEAPDFQAFSKALDSLKEEQSKLSDQLSELQKAIEPAEEAEPEEEEPEEVEEPEPEESEPEEESSEEPEEESSEESSETEEESSEESEESSSEEESEESEASVILDRSEELDQGVAEGGKASFYVQVQEGAVVRWERQNAQGDWYEMETDEVNGVTITTAAENILGRDYLTIDNFSEYDAVPYHCIVTDSTGTEQVIEFAFHLSEETESAPQG